VTRLKAHATRNLCHTLAEIAGCARFRKGCGEAPPGGARHSPRSGRRHSAPTRRRLSVTRLKAYATLDLCHTLAEIAGCARFRKGCGEAPPGGARHSPRSGRRHSAPTRRRLSVARLKAYATLDLCHTLAEIAGCARLQKPTWSVFAVPARRCTYCWSKTTWFLPLRLPS